MLPKMLLRAVTIAAGLMVVAGAATGAPTEQKRDGVSQVILEAYLEAERQADARREYLQSSTAREQRARSRTAFGSKSSVSAAAIAADHFGGLVREPLWEPPGVLAGDRVVDYRGQHVAVLHRDGERRPTLVDSTVPLLARDGAGEMRPTSVGLVDAGAWFEPENALVPSRFPKHLREGLSLAGGRLQVGVGEPDSAGEPLGERVIYANAAVDTDWIAGATPTGIALYAQLRSPRAPEELTLDISSATGPRPDVRANGNGGLDVVGDGGRIATVSPPVAFDAQRSPVPTRYVVDGSRVRVQVEHASRDVAYPVLLDPVIDYQQWQSNTASDPRTGMGGWNFFSWWTTFWSSTNGAWGPGLYSVVGAPNHWYTHGSDSWWHYRPPAPDSGTAYIYAADFKATTHAPADATRPVCITRGIFTWSDWERYSSWWHLGGSGAGTSGTGPHVYCSGMWGNSIRQCILSSCSPDGISGRAGNFAVFQQWIYGDNYRHSGTYSYMGAATVYMSDPEPPSIWGGPAATVNDPSQQWTFYHSDPGLGVYRVDISSPTFPEWNQAKTVTFPCYGTSWSPCPNSTQSGSPTYGNLPPGTHTIRVRVADAGGRATTSDWTVNVGYYSSIRYGGANAQVDTAAEKEAARQAMIAAGDDGYTSIFYGFTPVDQDVLSEYIEQRDPDSDADAGASANEPEGDGIVADASSEYICRFIGEPWQAGKQRPKPPFRTGTGNDYRIVARAEFKCDRPDVTKSVNIKTCLKKLTVLNDGRIMWKAIECDDRTFDGVAAGEQVQGVSVSRACNGTSPRTYKTFGRVTSYAFNPDNLNKIVSEKRHSRPVWVRCVAGAA